MAELKDSGARRDFGTGAVRDVAEGKGDMFSLPAAAIIRVSKHYEQGTKKYSRLNYQKGIPISAFMDSALRHIFKYLDGWDDEDHLSAAAFNILGAIQMEERNPAMQDVEARDGKCGFTYKDEKNVCVNSDNRLRKACLDFGNSLARGLGIPETSANPPMPPVKPPKRGPDDV